MRAFPVLAILLSLSPIVLPAAEQPSAKADAALSRLEKAEKAVQSLRFSFTQKTVVKVTGEEQSLEGKASFQRPSRFRVQHATPRAMTAVSDGKTLWIHNPARNQVVTDKWENWSRSAGLPQGLLPFQEKPSDFRKKYDVAWVGREPKGDVLSFTPKAPGTWAHGLKVLVDDATGIPLRTELESSSIKTVTEVRSLEINAPLPDDEFTFRIPAGADVVGLSSQENR